MITDNLFSVKTKENKKSKRIIAKKHIIGDHNFDLLIVD